MQQIQVALENVCLDAEEVFNLIGKHLLPPDLAPELAAECERGGHLEVRIAMRAPLPIPGHKANWRVGLYVVGPSGERDLWNTDDHGTEG